MTASPPQGGGSTDNSRSNSTVSDYSTMGDTHSSVGSGSPRLNGDMSPSKSTMPTQKLIESLTNSPGDRSSSDSKIGFKISIAELKEKRFNSTPSKPETQTTVTMISPRTPENFVSPATTPRSKVVTVVSNSPTLSPTPAQGPSSLTNLSQVGFGLDSYNGSETYGTSGTASRLSLSQSAGNLPKPTSPATPKKKVVS